MIFESRSDAAGKLIPLLEKFKGREVVVLAIPRGAVPMGKLISSHFNWPLGLLPVKKIGHPMNPEYAIGAVSPEDIIIDKSQGIPQDWINREVERIRILLNRRLEMYMKNRIQPVLKNKTVILVDDGIATGYTMKASVELLRKQLPAKIVIAVPVASPSAVDLLKGLTDELIVLDVPDDFMGVGQFYVQFDQVSDEDVIRLMQT